MNVALEENNFIAITDLLLQFPSLLNINETFCCNYLFPLLFQFIGAEQSDLSNASHNCLKAIVEHNLSNFPLCEDNYEYIAEVLTKKMDDLTGVDSYVYVSLFSDFFGNSANDYQQFIMSEVFPPRRMTEIARSYQGSDLIYYLSQLAYQYALARCPNIEDLFDFCIASYSFKGIHQLILKVPKIYQLFSERNGFVFLKSLFNDRHYDGFCSLMKALHQRVPDLPIIIPIDQIFNRLSESKELSQLMYQLSAYDKRYSDYFVSPTFLAKDESIHALPFEIYSNLLAAIAIGFIRSESSICLNSVPNAFQIAFGLIETEICSKCKLGLRLAIETLQKCKSSGNTKECQDLFWSVFDQETIADDVNFEDPELECMASELLDIVAVPAE